MKKRYVVTTRDQLPPATTVYYPLVINSNNNIVIISEENFLAIKSFIPTNQLDVLGFYEENEGLVSFSAFLFNLFPDAQEFFFALNELEPPVVLNVVNIHSLPLRRKLKNSDYIYFFKDKNLFKIKFSNLIKYFNSITKCGEITTNQPTFQTPEEIDFDQQILNLQNALLQKQELIEKILSQYLSNTTKN